MQQDEDHFSVRGTILLVDISQSCNVAIYEPTSPEEALKILEWRKAMDEDMKMIHKNKTRELVNRPVDKHVIRVKWVFRSKLNADSSKINLKSRLVVMLV